MVSHIRVGECSKILVHEKQKKKINVIPNPGPILIQNKVHKSKTPCITVLIQNSWVLTFFSKDVKKLFYTMREADRQGYLLIKTVNGKKDFIFFFRRFHLLPFSELSPINLDVGPLDRFRERLKDIDKVVFALKGKEALSHSLRNVYHGLQSCTSCLFKRIPKPIRRGLNKF